MKRRLPSWRTFALITILAVIGLSSIYHYVPASLKKPNMTDLSPRLQPLFEKTKTVCFGRFVMEVPDTATVVYGPAEIELPIQRYVSEGDRLAEHVAAREAALKSEERKPTGSGKTLYKETREGTLPGQKIIIGYETFSSPFYKLESFLKVGADLFVQTAQVYPLKKEGEDSALLGTNEAIGLFNMIARNLRPRADDEIPAEPGICIDGGFIAEPPQYVYEWVTFGVRLKEFPDAHFSISLTKKDMLVESDALEPRLKRAEEEAIRNGYGWWYFRTKVFRRGERQIGDWKGSEALAWLPAQENASEAHEFTFLSQGVPKDPFQPVVDIKLNTGVEGNRTGGKRPVLTDEEAVALWDKLTSSIRVRPTGSQPENTNTALPPKIPLGERVLTGAACPQTGWWQCVEIERVQGGRRKHFTAGEPMPPVVLVGDPTLWQRVKGERPTHEMITVWKLMDYDEEPKLANAATTPSEEIPPLAQENDKDVVPPQADGSDDETPSGTA